MIKLECISTCSKNPNVTTLILHDDGRIRAYKNSGTDNRYHFSHSLRTRVIGYVQREPSSPEGSYSAPIIPETFSAEPCVGFSPVIIERPSAAHVENLRVFSIDKHPDASQLPQPKKKSLPFLTSLFPNRP